jgi:CheY-like chemotaxis protein
LNLSCLIVDDEPLARNLLTEYVRKVPYLQLIEACSSPLAAIEVLRNKPVDILFLDIQMPEVTGITLLKFSRKNPSLFSQRPIQNMPWKAMNWMCWITCSNPLPSTGS